MLSSSSPARRTSMFGVDPVDGFTTRRGGELGATREGGGAAGGGAVGGDAVVSRGGMTAPRGVVSARARVSTALLPPRNASAAPTPPSTTTAPATIGPNRRLRRGGALRAEGMAADRRSSSVLA